jgi:hypothetical protein
MKLIRREVQRLSFPKYGRVEAMPLETADAFIYFMNMK